MGLWKCSFCQKTKEVFAVKMEVSSQWQDGVVKVHARVRQFSKAAKIMGHTDFRDYAGLESAKNDEVAVDEWLDSVKGLKMAARLA